jgi:hypothetical protein
MLSSIKPFNVITSSICAVSFIFAGCSAPALRTSFNGYSGVYAEVSNQQMLLNLARCANGHPPYFLQLGQINSSYQFSRSLNGAVPEGNSGSQSTTFDAAGRVASRTLNKIVGLGSANYNIGATEQPTFSYTPLSGSVFSQAVLVPINSQVLFTLMQEGVPVDQLFRVLVHSIEFDGDGVRHTFINNPDREHAKQFADFLIMCGLARELQDAGVMGVDTKTSIDPAPAPSFANPSLEDAMKAAASGLFLQPDPADKDKFRLVKPNSTTGFKFDERAGEVFKKLAKNPEYNIQTAGILSTAPSKANGMSIQLRPFIGVLRSVSNEGVLFDQLVSDSKKTGYDFLAHIPKSQRQPILRIDWSKQSGKTVSALSSVRYFGKRYEITDLVDSQRGTYNRDVFSLLNTLFNQVMFDPNKLPTQQLIRVN